jgi:hypothetical protein
VYSIKEKMTTLVYRWAPRAHNMGVALGQSVPRNRSQTSNCNTDCTISSTVRLQFPGAPVVVCSWLCLIKSQEPHFFPSTTQYLTLGCAIRLSPNIKGYGSSILIENSYIPSPGNVPGSESRLKEVEHLKLSRNMW